MVGERRRTLVVCWREPNERTDVDGLFSAAW
jgi:hypothetical protein